LRSLCRDRRKHLNTMGTGVATVRIDSCSNIEGVLAEDVERSRGGDPDSAPRDRFRLTVAVLMLDIETVAVNVQRCCDVLMAPHFLLKPLSECPQHPAMSGRCAGKRASRDARFLRHLPLAVALATLPCRSREVVPFSPGLQRSNLPSQKIPSAASRTSDG
jgi:hypothetical protein